MFVCPHPINLNVENWKKVVLFTVQKYTDPYFENSEKVLLFSPTSKILMFWMVHGTLLKKFPPLFSHFYVLLFQIQTLCIHLLVTVLDQIWLQYKKVYAKKTKPKQNKNKKQTNLKWGKKEKNKQTNNDQPKLPVKERLRANIQSVLV